MTFHVISLVYSISLVLKKEIKSQPHQDLPKVEGQLETFWRET